MLGGVAVVLHHDVVGHDDRGEHGEAWNFDNSHRVSHGPIPLLEQLFFTVLRVKGALVVVSVNSGEFDLVAGLAYVAEVAEEDGVF